MFSFLLRSGPNPRDRCTQFPQRGLGDLASFGLEENGLLGVKNPVVVTGTDLVAFARSQVHMVGGQVLFNSQRAYAVTRSRCIRRKPMKTHPMERALTKYMACFSTVVAQGPLCVPAFRNEDKVQRPLERVWCGRHELWRCMRRRGGHTARCCLLKCRTWHTQHACQLKPHAGVQVVGVDIAASRTVSRKSSLTAATLGRWSPG